MTRPGPRTGRLMMLFVASCWVGCDATSDHEVEPPTPPNTAAVQEPAACAGLQTQLWVGTVLGVGDEAWRSCDEGPLTVAVLPERGVLTRDGQALPVGGVVERDALLHYRAGKAPGVERFELVTAGGSSVTVTVEVTASPIAGLGELVVWYDAALRETLTGTGGNAPPNEGQPVSRWAPVLAGQPAAAAELDREPAFVNAPGGHRNFSTLKLSGNQRLVVPTQLPFGPYTYAAAVRSAGGGSPVRGIVSAHGGHSGLSFVGEFPASRAFRGVNPEWALRPEPTVGWTVLSGAWSGTWHTLRVDGVRANTQPFSPKFVNGPVMVGDGGSAVDGAFDGFVGEVCAFKRALTASERRQVDAYLQSKWGSLLMRQAVVGWELKPTTVPQWIQGVTGVETLRGGEGDDLVAAGAGETQLWGGAGVDRFLFAHSGQAQIGDFEPGVDVLDLTGLLNGATGYYEDHVRIGAVAGGVALSVDVEGAGDFEGPELSVVLPGQYAIRDGDLRLGIETQLTDTLQPRLRFAGGNASAQGSLRVGDIGRLDLLVGSDDAPRRVVRSDMAISVAGALVDEFGRVRVHRPGPSRVQVDLEGLSLELDTDLLPPHVGLFEELEPLPLGTGSGAYQGSAWLDGGLFVTGQITGLGSRLLYYDDTLVLQRITAIPGAGNSGNHAGAPAIFEGRVYIPFMDAATLGQPEPTTGLCVVDADSLEVVDFIDTLGRFRYVDAIAFDGGDMWLPSFNRLHRIPMTPDGPDFDKGRAYSIFSGIGQLQGFSVRDGRGYAVAENTTSAPEMMGISVFDMAALEPDPEYPLAFGVNVSVLHQARRINTPAKLYPVRIPLGKPDHESLSFDPVDPRVVYLAWIPGGASLARLRLDPQLP